MMSIPPHNPTLDPAVQAVLAGLRRRIRLYVWAQGLAAGVVCLGAAFWASLALDWFFEPVWPVRALALVAAALGLGGTLYQLIGRRAFARLGDASMALLLERRFPELGDGLLTAVELAGQPPGEVGFSPAMLDRTTRAAVANVNQVQPAKVFHPGPLGRGLAFAAAAALSIAIFSAAVPNAIGTWARRNLLLGEEPWPRQTRLSIVGFDGGAVKVARGDDVEVRVRADTSMPTVPKTVRVRYLAEGGSRGRKSMNREGDAVPGRDPYQEYSCTFQGVLAPIDFDVVGGDARIAGLRIEVVDSPTVEELALECRYPAYMARPTKRMPVLGVTQIPLGTSVRLEGRANKDLVGVRIDAALEEPGAEPIAARIDADPRRFACDLGTIVADRTLLLSLHDADGIRSRQPLRLALGAVADEVPAIPIQLAGIGTAITAQARLPLVGRVTDDYGVARVWFEYRVDQGAVGQMPLAAFEGNPTDVPIDVAPEVRDLAVTSQTAPPAGESAAAGPARVQPGAKLEIALAACDRRDLGTGPNVATSQRWVLDVVTPERLQVLLQARELVLRQRFEMIIGEVADTRDSLLRIEFQDGPPAAEDDRAVEGAEPGDQPEAAPETSAQRQAALRALRCQRAVENCRKNAQETLGTADAFDDLRLQLINNRIDTEELKIRLGSGIADPLRHIAGEMFPEWEKRLLTLRDALEDAARGPALRDEARTQADAVLLAMNQVLARMTELEDFNEVIAILEEIVREQDALGEQTQRRHKALLQELLED
ncbi:MAG: hypothetical protein JW809_01465 [Pirellulales bacterium]|nr:hypothetical protein [Pirellulales bacterium]